MLSVFKQTIKGLRHFVKSRMHITENHSVFKKHGIAHYVNGIMTLIPFHNRLYGAVIFVQC